MAVTSSKQAWADWVGSAAEPDDTREYTAVWRVRTDDRNDGPQTVIDGYGGPLPGDGGYSIGNDSDPGLICKSVEPQRVDADVSRLDWNVIVKFGEPDGEEDDDGNDTDDPLLFRTEVQITPQQVSVPVEEGDNVDAFPGRPAFVKGPITNSAGEILVPPLEKEQSRWLYAIASNHSELGTSHKDWQDVVNADTVTITVPRPGGNETLGTFQPYTLKVETLAARLQYTNKIRHWHISLELLFRADGWRPRVLDKGFSATAADGKPDGYGGEFGPNSTNITTKVEVGTPRLRRITDPLGRPLKRESLLDGEGEVLPDGADPVYLEYRVYTEAALQNLIDTIARV